MPTEAFSLTDAETRILRLLVRGYTARFIAEQFVLSRETVRTHISHIYAKLDVHDRDAAVGWYWNQAKDRPVGVTREEEEST